MAINDPWLSCDLWSLFNQFESLCAGILILKWTFILCACFKASLAENQMLANLNETQGNKLVLLQQSVDDFKQKYFQTKSNSFRMKNKTTHTIGTKL